MIDFWEVLRRSENGELVEERDFDMRVVKAARKIVPISQAPSYKRGLGDSFMTAASRTGNSTRLMERCKRGIGSRSPVCKDATRK